MAQCATTALAGAVPRPCVRGARGRFGGLGPVPGVVSLPFPPSRPACPALRVAGCPVRVALTLARWYAIPRGLCVPRARSGCPSGSPRVPFACVCARAPAASAPPPLGGVACAPRAVPAQGAGRVVPRGLCPSACPAPVPGSVWGDWGRGALVPVPPYLAWGCCCEGRLSSGAPPHPTVRPLNGLLASATHVLWARVCGCGGQTLSPWPACPVGAACRGAGLVGGRPPGRVACHCCEGRLVSGAVPPPTACPLGRAAGVPRLVCSGCGRSGRGDPAPVPQRAPLRAGVAHCGGGGRASPGGVPSTVVRGV